MESRMRTSISRSLVQTSHAGSGDGAEALSLSSATEQKLRRDYFAHAGQVGTRYGVSVDDVVEHVIRAMRRRGTVIAPAVRHVADLTHAAACVMGCGLAWSDLHERYELDLVRSVGLGDQRALLTARRLLAKLREESEMDEGAASRGLSLRDYLGRPSLRHWLIGLVRDVGGPVVTVGAGPGGRVGSSATR